MNIIHWINRNDPTIHSLPLPESFGLNTDHVIKSTYPGHDPIAIRTFDPNAEDAPLERFYLIKDALAVLQHEAKTLLGRVHNIGKITDQLVHDLEKEANKFAES